MCLDRSLSAQFALLDQTNSVKFRILDTLTQNKTELEAMNVVSVFIAGSFWRQLRLLTE